MEAIQKEKKAIPECIGPCCAYDANISHSPTGWTWRQLQEYQDNLARQRLLKAGITHPTDEMISPKPIPTYEQFYNLKAKV